MTWFDKEVRTVLDGTRAMGASMRSKLDDAQLATLRTMAVRQEMVVEQHTHTDGSVEWAWAIDDDNLDAYWTFQRWASIGFVPLKAWWSFAGEMFGYPTEDTVRFVEWITQDPCPCPCPQCRPDLFGK